VHAALVAVICAASIAGVLLRPRRLPEWAFALAGAIALVAFGLVPPLDAGAAIARGTDVYLFLTGMMVLAELARREGVFDWVAGHAVAAAHGSRARLFALVYATGVCVTIVLSNDATAVVLTPAVAAAIRAAKVPPLPYLFACAFVANAASFVLPISNPANLVVFAGGMPALGRWLASFALPSLVTIGATFALLALASRADLSGDAAAAGDVPPLRTTGRVTLAGIAFTALALVIASAFDAPLGVTTFACGAIAFVATGAFDRAAFGGVARGVSWSVLVLVAGLFVLVRGLESTGLLAAARAGAAAAAAWPPVLSHLMGAGVAALASNLANNLPAGLLAGSAASSLHGHEGFRAAVAIGIDLGPNLSVTGSLATVLWLTALRREGIDVSAARFLRTGAVVMPLALVLAVLALSRSS
jgi:arsenical pump membrane protein